MITDYAILIYSYWTSDCLRLKWLVIIDLWVADYGLQITKILIIEQVID